MTDDFDQECEECGREFDSSEWEVVETTSIPSAKWECPTEGCDGTHVIVF